MSTLVVVLVHHTGEQNPMGTSYQAGNTGCWLDLAIGFFSNQNQSMIGHHQPLA